MNILGMDTTLTEILIGTKRVRHGSRPSDENVAYIRVKVDECTRTGRPIRLVSGWGAHKGYGLGPYCCADFLDMMAMQRLADLNDEVAAVYSPGIQVILFVEDYTRRMLTGKTWTEYPDSLGAMIGALGLDFVDIVRESDMVHVPGYERTIRENAQAILIGAEKEVGWDGDVNWDHYLERSKSEFPEWDDDERRRHVSIFLGSIVTRSRHRIVPPHDLKISFVAYPKSVPDRMRRGRLEYKVKPGKHTQCTPAPWACFGVVNGDDWTHASMRDVRAKPYRATSHFVNGIRVPALTGG